MELVRILWVGLFFFFALILIFTWSKLAVIARKIKAITSLVDATDEFKAQSKKHGVLETEESEEMQEEAQEE